MVVVVIEVLALAIMPAAAVAVGGGSGSSGSGSGGNPLRLLCNFARIGTLRHSLLQPACSNLTSKIRPSVLSPRPSWADPGKALLAEQVAKTLATMAQSESNDGFRIWNCRCYFCLSPYDVIRWLDAGLTRFRCMGQGSRNTKASYTP